MYKTKLTLAAIAALSSVSVYAADSDFSAGVKGLFLIPMGDASKKQFSASDNLPFKFLPTSGYTIEGNQPSATYPIIIGAYIGYSVSDSVGIRVGSYWGVKDIKYTVKYKATTAATPAATTPAVASSGQMDEATIKFITDEGRQNVMQARAERAGNSVGNLPNPPLHRGEADLSNDLRKQGFVENLVDQLRPAAAPDREDALDDRLTADQIDALRTSLASSLLLADFAGDNADNIRDKIKSKVKAALDEIVDKLSPEDQKALERQQKVLGRSLGAAAATAAGASADDIINTISLSLHVPVMVGFDYKIVESDSLSLGVNGGLGVAMWKASWSVDKAPAAPAGASAWNTSGDSDRSYSLAGMANLEAGINLGDVVRLTGSVGYGFFGEPDVKWGTYNSKSQVALTADQSFKLGSSIHGLVLSAGLSVDF